MGADTVSGGWFTLIWEVLTASAALLWVVVKMLAALLFLLMAVYEGVHSRYAEAAFYGVLYLIVTRADE